MKLQNHIPNLFLKYRVRIKCFKNTEITPDVVMLHFIELDTAHFHNVARNHLQGDFDNVHNLGWEKEYYLLFNHL